MTHSDSFFAPDPARIAARDALWRARLGGSLGYLGDVLEARGEAARARLSAVAGRLERGPVSPWVSCLYSKLVAEVSRPDKPAVGAVLDALVSAADLPPWREDPLPLGDASVPDPWWSHFRRLIDTDRALPFHPKAPSDEAAALCRRDIGDGLALLAVADPEFHAEVSSLARLIVLAAPEDDDPSGGFGACSTFFMRETVMVNAAVRRDHMRAIDMLVHETSHILLFGLAMEQSLTTDRGETRYASAARSDPRPIDGVYHACFVSTRVHLVMSRMIASGRLTDGQAAEAASRRDRNGSISIDTLKTLQDHASPTDVGREILEALSRYWTAAAPRIAPADAA